MQNATVYTKPACGPCLATKRMLTSRGVEFTEVDLAKATTAEVEQFRDAGHLQAPVVLVEGVTAERSSRTWSGFRPDLIDSINQTATREI